jgi:hypothetical protein
MWCIENDSEAVTRSVPVGLSVEALTADSASCSSARMALLRRRNSCPGSVRNRRRVLRSTSRAPSRSSSADRWRLAAALDRPSSSAARLRLPVSATCTNNSISVQRSNAVSPVFARGGKLICRPALSQIMASP